MNFYKSTRKCWLEHIQLIEKKTNYTLFNNIFSLMFGEM